LKVRGSTGPNPEHGASSSIIEPKVSISEPKA
jgi:hypothetical protein